MIIDYVIVCLCIFLVIFFYNFKKIKTVYGYYKIFKNTVDPENKKSCCTLFFEMSTVFYKLVFPQKPPESFKKHLKIPYKYKDKEYVYLLKKPKMIMPIEYIKDENDKDITSEIYPYLGPNLDCHNVDLFPSDFGITKMIVKDLNDKEYIFTEDEKIQFKKE
jgi:hypothetical protein